MIKVTREEYIYEIGDMIRVKLAFIYSPNQGHIGKIVGIENDLIIIQRYVDGEPTDEFFTSYIRAVEAF